MYIKATKGTQEVLVENELMEELYGKLKRYCFFLTQNEWDGEDIAQEAIIRAIDRYPSSDSISSALLKKIAYHHWIDTVRKRKKEELEEIADESMLATNISVAELMETVQKLTNRLTPKQAVVMTLKEAMMFTSKEISDILDTTEVSVKSILHRAKKRFEKEEDHFVHSIWDEDEQLSNLLYHTLKTEDPTKLIEAIPFFRSLQTESIVPSRIQTMRSKTISPSNTFSMAA